MHGIELDTSPVALPRGFRTGHWTNAAGTSGCTVVFPPQGNVCGYEARGSATGTRELACLDLSRARTEVHGIVLTGGSAFGLAAADGVMSWLSSRGIGFKAGPAIVPIVPAAVIFDTGAFNAEARPDAMSGAAACDAATEGPFPRGRVGAGAGATAGKWAGIEFLVPAGLGGATARAQGHTVTAIAVANPAGDVIAEDGSVLAGSTNPSPAFALPPEPRNTVLAVVAFEAAVTKPEAAFVAARGSDGITRAVRPAHTRYDGDVVFAVGSPPAAGASPAAIDLLGVLATEAVAAAVRDAVTSR